MKRINSWSKAEEETVAKCVNENPLNLGKAFNRASTLLGRTPGAISGKYYSSIKKKSHLFKLHGKSSEASNVKNKPEQVQSFASDALVSLMSATFKNLSPQQKVKFFEEIV